MEDRGIDRVKAIALLERIKASILSSLDGRRFFLGRKGTESLFDHLIAEFQILDLYPNDEEEDNI